MTGQRDRARIAVLASRVGFEEKRILATLDRRAVPYDHVDPRTVWLPAGEAVFPWRVALNREIGYQRAVQAARGMAAGGIRVLNSLAATEICGDKWQTTLALRQAGLPVPRTALALTPGAALDALDALGYPAVVKPLVGSWGRLVTLVPDRRTGETVMEYIAALPSPQAHIVYVQEYIPNPGRDIRAVVVGDEVVGASYRRGAGWRTNAALGGAAEACPLAGELAKLAVCAAQATGAAIAGVDLIEDAAGAPYVLEVNHRVEFAGLQSVLGDGVDVAARVVDHLLAEAGRW